MLDLRRRQSNNDDQAVRKSASSSRSGGRSASAKPLGTIGKSVSRGVKPAGLKKNRFSNRSQKPGAKQKKSKGAWKRQAKRKEQQTPESQQAARLRRFRLQSEAARILPKEGVAECLRRKIPVKDKVIGAYVPATGSAHFENLKVCKSVWMCPCCASVISEKRRKQLERLITAHIAAGGSVYLVTRTIRHGNYHALRDLLTGFLAAAKAAKGGRRAKPLREKYHIIGTITALEVTWGRETGHHPHSHELIFVQGELDIDAYEQEMRAIWEQEAARQGLSMNEHGFEVKRTFGAVADYVAKYGKEPESEPWGIEAELTKNHIKQGRADKRYTPFGLLAAIEAGDESLKPIFYEYATCFKGRRQLHASPGLFERYEISEKTDEELMEEHEHERAELVEFDDDQWAAVLGNDIRGEVQEALRTGRPGLVLDFLGEFGIRIYPEQYTRFAGWQVMSPAGAGTILSVRRCEVLQRWRCSIMLDQAGENGKRWQAFDLAEISVIAGESPGVRVSDKQEAGV